MARKKTPGPLGPLLDFLSSFGLACVLLMCLFILTLAATFAYGAIGEAGVKHEFFVPWVAWLGGKMPFPGGSLVFSLLALNLLIGGLVRIRYTWRNAGVIVAHIGIVWLVVAGVVNFELSSYGMMKVYEGTTENTYRDFTEVELTVWEADVEENITEFAVEDRDLRSCADQERTFSNSEVPFDITLSGFLPHCNVLPSGPMWQASSPVVEGWALQHLSNENVDPHHQVAGIVARVQTDEGLQTGLLTARDVAAWTVKVDGKWWGIDLHNKRHRLPFEVYLDDVVREDLPGTNTPMVYKSDVTYGEEGHKTTIRMNHPLREEGHVLFQSQWGQDTIGEYSGFSTTRNPSDQWPKYACWVIAFGLLAVFGDRLRLYTLAQAKKRAQEN